MIEWHSTDIKTLLLVNKGRIFQDQHGKLTYCLPEDHKEETCLPCDRKIMSLAPKPG
jgi:hypothetical protein